MPAIRTEHLGGDKYRALGSKGGWYEISLGNPYSCTCPAFAIARNRAKNKQPDLEVTCKHIKAVCDQHGVQIEPFTAEQYAEAMAELDDLLKDLKD